ncbi:MAG TPA: 16S rRNA (cytosine(1402)-N(4))-methyltransferase RsmH [Spirochaetia bacterium]|nr:16S rRNA (cytosine(1402)-N(4))-methyltransferase RsmH [Spirochaetia bacterium]
MYHVPVMLEEVLSSLAVTPDGIYLDCTLGGGGHARAVLDSLGPGGRLVGLDRDADALAAAGVLASDPRVSLAASSFDRLGQVLRGLGIETVNGILFDLGVSSHQLDEPERGFSYHADGPLDMRMDQGGDLTAAGLLATASEKELARILWTYGEERYGRRIAAGVVRARAREPVVTTGRLVEVIRGALPAGVGRVGPHPARRTFQALRIAVNDELGYLQRGLAAAVEALAPGGRVVVISYHSLEDRIVKQYFVDLARSCVCPPGLPVCRCDHRPVVRLVAKKPLTPGPGEVEANPRSRSAKLRAAEKLPVTGDDRERMGESS